MFHALRQFIRGRLAILFVTLCLLPVPGLLADEGLYAPAPPDGAAFVRVHNATELPTAINADDANRFGTLAPGETSAYLVFEAGTHALDSAQHEFESGGFYTFLLAPDNTRQLVADPTSTRRDKALLALYNVGCPSPVSLHTADGRVNIIAPVATGSVGSRVLNALKVPLAARHGDGAIDWMLGDLVLVRGGGYSIFLSDCDGTRSARIVETATDTQR